MLNLKKKFVGNVWRKKFKRKQMQHCKHNTANPNVKTKIFSKNNDYGFKEE